VLGTSALMFPNRSLKFADTRSIRDRLIVALPNVFFWFDFDFVSVFLDATSHSVSVHVDSKSDQHLFGRISPAAWPFFDTRKQGKLGEGRGSRNAKAKVNAGGRT
jgi:hypothetical protein